MIYVTADSKKVYTTNITSGTVSILTQTQVPAGGNRTREDWMQTIIPVNRGCEGFDVSPDGAELWTASAEDGKIFIIDLSAKNVAATIDAKVTGANRLMFSPDGKLVFIPSLRSETLAIYDAKTRKEMKQLKIGHGAAGIVMAPGGSHAFVACTPDNYLVVIDLKTLDVVHQVDVGKQPDGLAWAIQK
jgi:YVTN family beta-propeller protein